ncbi:YdiH family protein [Enterobacter hormaechei]|nr:YdiH family protein [Enterobacter hormaechei]
MDTEITPTQLAIEYLRRDKSNLSPAQYLKKLKQLELEFTDLLALSSNELKEEIYFASAVGRSRPLSSEEKGRKRGLFCV